MGRFEDFVPFLQISFGVNFLFAAYAPFTHNMLQQVASRFRRMAAGCAVLCALLLYGGRILETGPLGLLFAYGHLWIWVLLLPLPAYGVAARWRLKRANRLAERPPAPPASVSQGQEVRSERIVSSRPDERRAFLRVKPLLPYRVEYLPHDRRFPSGLAECVNISRGGLALPVCFPENTRLDLVIRLADTHEVRSEGVVVWSTPAQGGAPFSGILLSQEIDLP